MLKEKRRIAAETLYCATHTHIINRLRFCHSCAHSPQGKQPTRIKFLAVARKRWQQQNTEASQQQRPFGEWKMLLSYCTEHYQVLG